MLTKVVGAGESGKSTVLKQMRLIHTKGFSSMERKQWKVTIFNNLLHAFQVIFGAMEEQEVDFAQESNIVSTVIFNWLETFADIRPALCRGHCSRSRDRYRRLHADRLPQCIQELVERRRRTDGHQEGQRIRTT